jgi:micrococcal nuclease
MTRWTIASRVVVAVAALATSCTAESASDAATTPSPAAAAASATPSGTRAPDANALVTRVVDGDTVEVDFRERALTVRLIGIDTPESVAPGEPVQCFALEASSYTTERLEGERVRLEFAVVRIDPYSRTLAYVWLGDELFNETLVREGYAFVTTYPPNVRYVDRFRSAQREARSTGRGVWGRCVHEGACDPAYTDGCIPPPPPDLDCSNIDERRFTVLAPDPHNFDGDHNGIGCEEP